LENVGCALLRMFLIWYYVYGIYSSASNYLEEGKGILEVEILDSFYNYIS